MPKATGVTRKISGVFYPPYLAQKLGYVNVLAFQGDTLVFAINGVGYIIGYGVFGAGWKIYLMSV
jgi:hypothetical protein